MMYLLIEKNKQHKMEVAAVMVSMFEAES